MASCRERPWRCRRGSDSVTDATCSVSRFSTMTWTLASTVASARVIGAAR